jgi:hypothetical protein
MRVTLTTKSCCQAHLLAAAPPIRTLQPQWIKALLRRLIPHPSALPQRRAELLFLPKAPVTVATLCQHAAQHQRAKQHTALAAKRVHSGANAPHAQQCRTLLLHVSALLLPRTATLPSTATVLALKLARKLARVAYLQRKLPLR